MSDQPTLQTVVTDSLARLDFGATASPLPDKFGQDYRALHDYYIADLAAEVKAAPPITDKASREVSQRIRTRLVAVRIGLDKTRKALFEPMRALKAEVDAYIGTTSDAGLQGRVKALERVLEQQQEAWDAEQERIRQEAVRIIDDRNRARAKRVVDAGMHFDGACYKLMDVMVYPTDLNRLKDEEFDEWFTGVLGPAIVAKQDADRIDAEDKLRKARAQELTDTGIVDYINAEKRIHSFDHPDGTTHIVEAELGTMPEDKWQQWITMARTEANRRKAAKEAAAKEEHERMQAEFRRQAEVQRKQDEERAAIDAERANLKAEKQRVRHERLIALGADKLPLGPYVVWRNSDLNERYFECVSDLAGLNDEDWQYAQDAVKRSVAKGLADEEEKMRMNKQTVARGETLAILGAERDETGTWTLGNATTTHHLLAGMSAEDWNATLTKFEAEAEADELPISTAPDEADLRELHACALSLLDEVNKVFTTLGSDERYSEALAKVQAHAGDCVRITRELQTESA